ncbi:hypothetical protein SE17_38025, partial [Kouleothrix aurantiaca]
MDEQDTRTHPRTNGSESQPLHIPETHDSDDTQVGTVVMGPPHTTQSLSKDRTSPTRRAEQRAAQQVARERIASLVTALGDTSNPLHQSAVDKLVEIGPAAVPALNEALNPNRPRARRRSGLVPRLRGRRQATADWG